MGTVSVARHAEPVLRRDAGDHLSSIETRTVDASGSVEGAWTQGVISGAPENLTFDAGYMNW